MSLTPSRSAIVRASLMILEHALADRPILSMILSRRFRHSTLSGQCFSMRRLFIEALQNIPSSSKRSFCICLAFSTLLATAELGSPRFLSTSLLGSIGFIQSWISIHTSDFYIPFIFINFAI